MRLRNRLQFQRRMQERLRKQIIATDEKIWDAPISSKDDKFSTRLMQIAEQLITDPNFSPETLAVELGVISPFI